MKAFKRMGHYSVVLLKAGQEYSAVPKPKKRTSNQNHSRAEKECKTTNAPTVIWEQIASPIKPSLTPGGSRLPPGYVELAEAIVSQLRS